MHLLIIPDEWLVHDLKGSNGEEAQREAHSFLKKVYTKCDKLVILEGSPFVSKIYKLLFKDARPNIHLISRFISCNFLQNSEKCVKLADAKALPANLQDKVPCEDRYLFEIRETLQEGVIVTTDGALMSLPEVRSRDEFLEKYNERAISASKHA
jgi:hypothetical protein